MSDASTGLNDLTHEPPPPPAVWVLDDPQDGVSGPALGIAERLGVPFRRIPLAWNWLSPLAAFSRHGSLLGLTPAGHDRSTEGWQSTGVPRRSFASATGPALVLSAGRRAASVALWLKSRFASPVVQCMHAGPRGGDIDMLVLPRHLGRAPGPGVLPILGVPHRLSPLMLHQARQAWQERLSHMPRPRVALLAGGPAPGWLGGSALGPFAAHAMAQQVATLVRQSGGSVLATTTGRTGEAATNAVSAGLSTVMHVLHRWGEPGENPYHGFLGMADAVVVTGDAVAMLSEACTTEGPVFIAMPELGSRAVLSSFLDAGQARLIGEDLSPWPRRPLDEAGRVAAAIRARYPLD